MENLDESYEEDYQSSSDTEWKPDLKDLNEEEREV